MRRWLRHFFVAQAFFTRVPVPRWVGYEPDDLDRAAAFFPLIGLLVGVVVAAVWWLAAQVFPPRVAVLLSMAAGLLLTGAFHEDGLADAVDGFGGGYTRDDVLRIMQDSRIGSFGALALIIALGLKLELLSTLPAPLLPGVLVVAHGCSRWLSISLLLDLDYARPQGKSKALATRMGASAFVFASLCGVLPLLLLDWQAGLLCLLLLAGGRQLFAAWLRRRIGGYSGDALGMAQQLAELVIYLVFVAWHCI